MDFSINKNGLNSDYVNAFSSLQIILINPKKNLSNIRNKLYSKPIKTYSNYFINDIDYIVPEHAKTRIKTLDLLVDITNNSVDPNSNYYHQLTLLDYKKIIANVVFIVQDRLFNDYDNGEILNTYSNLN